MQKKCASRRALRLNAITRRELAATAGIKFHKGDYRETQDGSPLELDLQPGTGSYAGLFGLSFYQGFQKFHSLAVSGNASYQWQSENPDGYVIGQEFGYGAGVGWLSSLPGTDFFIQSRGRFALEDKANGSTVTATGAHLIDVVPSVHCRWFERLSEAISAAVPVYRSVNELQVTPSYGFSAVLRYDLTMWKDPASIDF